MLPAPFAQMKGIYAALALRLPPATLPPQPSSIDIMNQLDKVDRGRLTSIPPRRTSAPKSLHSSLASSSASDAERFSAPGAFAAGEDAGSNLPSNIATDTLLVARGILAFHEQLFSELAPIAAGFIASLDGWEQVRTAPRLHLLLESPPSHSQRRRYRPEANLANKLAALRLLETVMLSLFGSALHIVQRYNALIVGEKGSGAATAAASSANTGSATNVSAALSASTASDDPEQVLLELMQHNLLVLTEWMRWVDLFAEHSDDGVQQLLEALEQPTAHLLQRFAVLALAESSSTERTNEGLELPAVAAAAAAAAAGDAALRRAQDASPRIRPRTWQQCAALISSLRVLVVDGQRAVARLASLQSKLARPIALVTNWMRYSLYFLGCSATATYIYRHRENLSVVVDNAVFWLRLSYERYVSEPIVSLWKTVRYDEGIRVITEESLTTDVQSLVRMVTEFAKQQKYSDADVQAMVAQALEGNLDKLMPLYESYLSSPLSSALFGPLLQLLLIQVQKQRVDLARALLALDKLMRSNELNFELFACVPLGVASVMLVQAFSQWVLGRGNRRQVHASIRSQLRDVERLLNRGLSEARRTQQSGAVVLPLEMTLADSGRLWLSLYELKKAIPQLASEHRATFEQDIADLEAEDLPVAAKLNVLVRMHHTYAFMRPT